MEFELTKEQKGVQKAIRDFVKGKFKKRPDHRTASTIPGKLK